MLVVLRDEFVRVVGAWFKFHGAAAVAGELEPSWDGPPFVWVWLLLALFVLRCTQFLFRFGYLVLNLGIVASTSSSSLFVSNMGACVCDHTWYWYCCVICPCYVFGLSRYLVLFRLFTNFY